MFRDLTNPLSLLNSTDLQIHENNADLTDWGICLSKAYRSPLDTAAQYSEATQQYIRAHKQQDWHKTPFHHFVGYVDDLPVSCLTLSLQNQTARIDDVGTIPEQQHKGHATQLLVHGLNQAKIMGATICFLESSQAGFKIYQKLGFEALYSNLYFRMES